MLACWTAAVCGTACWFYATMRSSWLWPMRMRWSTLHHHTPYCHVSPTQPIISYHRANILTIHILAHSSKHQHGFGLLQYNIHQNDKVVGPHFTNNEQNKVKEYKLNCVCMGHKPACHHLFKHLVLTHNQRNRGFWSGFGNGY